MRLAQRLPNPVARMASPLNAGGEPAVAANLGAGPDDTRQRFAFSESVLEITGDRSYRRRATRREQGRDCMLER